MNQKEIELKPKDYDNIQDYATTMFIRSAITHQNMRVECIVQAFLSFSRNKGYTVRDGKIYKEEKPVSNS